MSNDGKVTIDKQVISTVAYLTALAVPGVASLGGGWTSGLADFFSKGITRGVRLKFEEESAILNLSLNVEYGVDLVEIGRRVKEEVARGVTSTVGLPVKEVNVMISNIT